MFKLRVSTQQAADIDCGIITTADVVIAHIGAETRLVSTFLFSTESQLRNLNASLACDVTLISSQHHDWVMKWILALVEPSWVPPHWPKVTCVIVSTINSREIASNRNERKYQSDFQGRDYSRKNVPLACCDHSAKEWKQKRNNGRNDQKFCKNKFPNGTSTKGHKLHLI